MANPVETIDFSKIVNQTISNASLIYSTNPKIASLCVFSLAFFVYYYKQVVKKPRFICNNRKFKEFLLQNCRQIIEKPVWVTFWAYGTHAQTILANVIRSRLQKLHYRREIIKMPDGGETALDWYESSNQDKAENSPIVILMPGLTGDSNTEYITSLVPIAESCGLKTCVMINRGRGGLQLKTPRLYCASNCEDAEFVLNHLKNNHPDSKLIAVGISLGGIVLGRYLALSGDKAVVDAAMLISVCYDFFAGCQSLETNRLNLALNKHLSRSLKTILNDQRPVLELNKKLDYEAIQRCKTLREFDEEFTCKMWNYDTVEDYYRDASLKDRLQLIKRPVLCLNAEDDMFQPIDSLPIEEFEKSPNLALLLTSRGGHIGGATGVCFLEPSNFFIERLVKEYLNSLKDLENIKESIG